MKYDYWKIPNTPACLSNAPECLLSEGYPPLLAAVLASRGFDCADSARGFLESDSSSIHDPMLLADMDKAVSRIRMASDRGEHVAVYGDYDVDGITASCLMTDCIRSMGLRCELYIPDRIEEGYGLNAAAIDCLSSMGVNLIITVDCGVTGVEETLHARSLGIDMIITDHHECSPTLPEAAAVIDPKRPDCKYPFKYLAGVGVAFKLACALSGDTGHTLKRYADLVAIGSIADVMPLTGENRHIIREGLENILSSPRPGIKALINEAGIDGKKPSAMNIGFSIAPRLNASGRLGRSDIAAELLLSADPMRCGQLSNELCSLNRSRQNIEHEIWEQATSMLDGTSPDTPIVLAEDNWHQGVVGIAASRLTEAFSLPAIMICLDGDKGKGSCRSFGGFNLFEALSACKDELESFGGHALAAGLTIRRDKIDSFRSALAKYYADNKPEHGSALNIDLCIGDPNLLNRQNVSALELLEPCGKDNPRVILCMTGVEIESITPIGGGKHLKLKIRKFGTEFDCVFFAQRAEDLDLLPGDRADIAFTPQINEFRGRSTIQLLVTSMRRTDEHELCRRILTGAHLTVHELADSLPQRSDFVKLWKRLSALGGTLDAPLEDAMHSINTGGFWATDCLCFAVFEDIGLINISFLKDQLVISQKNNPGKADLEASVKLKMYREIVASLNTDNYTGR